jgi:hypothetical protein
MYYDEPTKNENRQKLSILKSTNMLTSSSLGIEVTFVSQESFASSIHKISLICWEKVDP